ncbi:hypothetical protein WJX77_001300 [Trebouxia sp. C0004]
MARLPPDPPVHSQQTTDRNSSEQQQQVRGNINGCIDTVTTGQTATPQAFNSCPVSKQQMDNMSVEQLQKALQIVKCENGYLTAFVDTLRHQHQQNNHILDTPLTALVTTKCNSLPQKAISDSASGTRVATQKRSHSATSDDATVVPAFKARKSTQIPQ